MRRLRVGIIHRGKLVDERTFQRGSISVGRSERATLSFPAGEWPERLELFGRRGNRFVLQIDDGVEARVQRGGGEVRPIRGTHLALEEDMRGKVTLGDVSILFAFVDAPKREPLPLEARGFIGRDLDVKFAGLFVAVAIVQFSLLAYARTLPLEEAMLESRRFTQSDWIPIASMRPPPEEPRVPAPKDPVSRAREGGPAHRPTRRYAPTRGIIDAIEAKSRDGRGAVASVFGDPDGVQKKLDEAFLGIQGVATRADVAGTRGGLAGLDRVSIGTLATSGGGDVSTDAKGEVAVPPSEGGPQIDGPIDSAAIAQAMKDQIKAIKSCYEGALKRDRTLAGKLVLRMEIDAAGHTVSVDFDDDTLKSAQIERCIQSRAAHWHFPKHQGETITVAYPLVFTPTGD
jgi:hypothetical protein